MSYLPAMPQEGVYQFERRAINIAAGLDLTPGLLGLTQRR